MMNEMVVDYLPLLVPSALLLWVLKDVGALKTMMATTLQKALDLEVRVQKLEGHRHDTNNNVHTLSTRIDLLEWKNRAAVDRKESYGSKESYPGAE